MLTHHRPYAAETRLAILEETALVRILRVGLAVWLMAAAVFAQASLPCSPNGMAGIPTTPWPGEPPMVFRVDPRAPFDPLALVPGSGVTCSSITQAVLVAGLWTAIHPNRQALIQLMPGSYGAVSTGETMPISMPPRVSIQGLDALTVVIRGDERAPPNRSRALPLPVTDDPSLRMRTPAFHFGAEGQSGYDFSFIGRLTIVGAEIGVLISGPAQVSPSILECAFIACDCGVQIQGGTTPEAPPHRPLLLWNTFGDCTTGVFISSGLVPPAPAIVNCVFDGDAPFEGVPCSAVTGCAFAPIGVNTSRFVDQPVSDPTPIVDLSAFSRRDLYVGARSQLQTPEGPRFFTDWRPMSLTLSGNVNPLLVGGRSDFPFATPNGTWARLVYPGFVMGQSSSEGPGTLSDLPTKLTPPGSGGRGAHIGYRHGGSLYVGGGLPGEKRFGTGIAGITSTRVYVHFSPDFIPLDLIGTIVALPAWPATGTPRLAPTGMLESPIMTPMGLSFLDPAYTHFDLRNYLSISATQIENYFPAMAYETVIDVPILGIPHTTFVVQAIGMHRLMGVLRVTDAQHFELP